jgi:enoyl-CoA hydratase/carnithine racemase
MPITTAYPTTPPATVNVPPPSTRYCILSFPTPQILLVTLNRPESLNCINTVGHWELDAVWKWLDESPGLRVGIITGKGRGFCAGMDLKGLSDFPQLPVHIYIYSSILYLPYMY